MNKNFYRIVFNKARGMLMVVGEFATSAHGTASPSSVPGTQQGRISKLSALQFALLIALGCVSVSASAGIVADSQAPGNQQPVIVSAANGTPQVNIQTPSAAGVSRNVYSQFDVDKHGVVLNNSHASTQTQLAGMVNGNANLAGGEARIILNEVNARNASQLNGMIEVAGQKAQVVIANPSGITCNGCGFINAHRATLTTGQVQMNNGLVTGYEVNNGEIVIQGAGLDSSRQDSTDLIARAVKVNAGIWASELKVTTGRNSVDADHNRITAKAADGGTAPVLAIDVAGLGGMYANKIRLLGTEKGVGVHNAGNIGASAGDVVVNADGSIGNTGSLTASKNLHLISQSQVENSGKIFATGNTDITASGWLNNNGVIAASNNTTLNAASVASSSGGALAAGINSDGTLGLAGNLTVTSQGELKVNGQASAAGQLTATGTVLDLSGSQTFGSNVSLQASSGSISTKKATLAATHQLTASARDAINNDSGKISADRLNLKARSLSSQQGLIQQLGTDDLQLSFADLNNAGGQIASNGLNLMLNTASFNNQQGSLLHTGAGELNIFSEEMNSSGGSLLTDGSLDLIGGQLVLNEATVQANQLSIRADALSHRRGNTVQTGSGEMSVTVKGLLDNQAGRLAANGNMLLTAKSLNNQQGHLIAAQNGALQINLQEKLNNQQGVLAAAGNLSLASTGLNNAGGLLKSGANMVLALADGDLINRDSGSNGGILSHGTLSVHSGNIDNTAGFIAAGGDTTLSGQSLSNLQGTLASDAGLSLTTGTLNNQSGRVQAGTSLNLNTRDNTLTNTGGVFSAGQTLTLLTGALLNSSGQLIGSGTLQLNTYGQLLDNSNGTIAISGNAQLDTGTLLNISGQMQLAGNALIHATGAALDNTSGLIRGGKSLSLTANQLFNRNTLSENTGIEGQSVTLVSATVDNAGGAVRANNLLDITSSAALNNSGGLISSASQLNFNGGDSLAFTNTAGTLIGGNTLNLSANSLSGDGRVLSQDAMTLVLQQAFFNQGDVIANGDMHFTTASSLVNQSLIRAGGVLNLHAAELENQQSAEISAGENHLLIAGNVTNRGLLDGGLTHVSSSVLTNTGTGRIYGDRLALQTGTLNNLTENGTAATIAARDRLDIGAGQINNRAHGLIYSAGDMTIGGALDDSWRASGRASVLNNHGATLESAGNMTLNIGEINNINDHLITEEVVVERSFHHEAVLSSSTVRYDWDDVDTSTKNKYNVHAAIMPDGTRGRTFYEYQYERTITETRVKESDPGQIMAGGNLTISSDRLNNHDSRIVAGGLLGGVIGELNNIATLGERIVTDIGMQIRWYAKKSSNGRGGTKTSQGKDRSVYTPDDIIQTIDLQTLAWQGNEAISSSGTTLVGRDTSGTGATIIRAGDITAETGLKPVMPPSGQQVEIIQPGSDGNDTAIRMIVPVTTLPDNSLYQLQPASDVPVLIETDPRFTDKKQWLGSDYMQNQLTTDPGNVLKRLGDGFYEQQLIRQQVVALIGNRYLNGYSSDEAQFRALMDTGVAFGKDFNLKIGVALTAQQMALLTSDMIWLVKQTVTLADGSTQDVLVPQLYARVKSGDLNGSGALLAGDNLSLDVSNDLTNSGHISGRDVTQLTAENLNNSGFIGGSRVDLRARTDINNIGGTLQGDSSLTAVAGRDINSISTLGGSPGNITFDRPAGIYVQNDSGTLSLQAMNNVNLTASQITNSGEGSQTQIIAGNDLNLNTLTTTSSEKGSWGKGNDRTLTQSTDTGSQIAGNGEVMLQAGHDLNARAATVSAGESLSVVAGSDINITSGSASFHLTENSHQSSGGLLSKKSLTTHDEIQSQRAVSSSFGGDSVTLLAGHDLNITGSNVVGTGDVTLAAGNNLTVSTADETRQENHLRREKKSGLSGTGGIGVTAGSSTLKITDDTATHSSLGSTVGSTQGSVSLTAGSGLTVKGSEVLAAKDLSLTGKEVNILAAENQSSQSHKVEQKQSGLTLALSGAAGSAINSAVTTVNEATKESDGRLAALQGVKAALSGVSATQAARLDAARGDDPDNKTTAGLSLSYGSQSSKSQSTLNQKTQQESSLTAGSNLSITATGSGVQGENGDISVQGSQLQAGKDMLLSANRDVNLVSAEESSQTRGSNSSKGGSVGVGITAGSGGTGFNVSASVSAGKGHENADSVSHRETTLNAGNQVTIISGRDTILTGAQVSGETVKMDVGRNLTLTSEQDRETYDSKQQSASAGAGYTSGAGTATASVNASRDKMNSDWQSVTEQTGIFAGKGGFDVTVGEHTQLDGAVIGSTAAAEKNKLDTGTIGWRDIRNEAAYEVEHQSVGVSTGGSIGDQFKGNMAGNLLAGLNGSDSASSTTHSAVSEGTITVRDQEKQTQDIAQLSRDVENANPGLDKIFDAEKERNRLKAAQLVAEIGAQAMDIASTEGQIAGEKAKRDPAKLSEAKAQLESKGKAFTDDDVAKQAYNNAMASWGTGSAIQQGISAATAAIQGLAGGNIAQAVSGAAAPYLAEQIHKLTTDANGKVNTEANLMAHAVVGAVTAYAAGNSALAGASGAVMGEYIAQQMYRGVDRKDLTEDQKQTISALGTLAAGLAGGVVGDSTADAVAGAQAGKNAVENNALSDLTDALAAGKTPQKQAQERVDEQNERYKAENCAGISAEACSVKMYTERREQLKEILSAGADFVPVVGDIKSFAEAHSALDYLAAAVGLIPGAGDTAGKIIKAAETALKKGDVAEASRLINKASDEVSATLPMGSKRNPMNQPGNPSYQPVRNQPGTISNREYSGHALDRMQDRGITPSVVENTIKNGKSTPSRGGTTVHFDPESKVSVVTNESGRVVTVKYGDK
ncbi:hemagglutinin repeat-containing protein [Pantoea sp. MBD-2R]|uniref:hemagglutinin repeat-containing protein n=1 Tax=Pantoea sp. MBD-2R TaxID=3141540 RepID=UPI0031832A99